MNRDYVSAAGRVVFNTVKITRATESVYKHFLILSVRLILLRIDNT